AGLKVDLWINPPHPKFYFSHRGHRVHREQYLILSVLSVSSVAKNLQIYLLSLRLTASSVALATQWVASASLFKCSILVIAVPDIKICSGSSMNSVITRKTTLLILGRAVILKSMSLILTLWSLATCSNKL